MSHGPAQTVVIQHTPGTSGLAIAGLVFSILGWLTCGLLCIPGAILCLVALLAKGPKGTAIAGLIVGFPGVLFFIFVGLGMIMAFLGLGAAATAARDAARDAQMQHEAMIDSIDCPAPETSIPDSDSSILSSEPIGDKNETVPPATDGSQSSEEDVPAVAPKESNVARLVPDTPPQRDEGVPISEVANEWRTWTSANRKFTVEAKFVAFNEGEVTLQRRDGKKAVVKLDQLILEDRVYVQRRITNADGGE